MDSNLHLDYVREIQGAGRIPVQHPHLYQSDVSSIPFPYPLGYHLTMVIFPHWVSLYKVLGVLFAGISLILVIKISKLFGYKGSLAIITPLALSLSFSRLTITPHPDMFALMLILMSTYFTLRYLREENLLYLALAAGFGFYAGVTREIAVMTFPFIWLVLWLKFNKRRRYLFRVIIPIVLLIGLGYYLINPIFRGTNLLYPIQGQPDPIAYEWYLSHLSFWSSLAHGYFMHTLGIVVVAFSTFIPLFFIKPQDKTLALVFGGEILVILLLMPSTAGLARYVMFTLPFLTIAYGNHFENNKRWIPLLFLGALIIYPAQGIYLNSEIPNDLNQIASHLDQNDYVLAREQGQIAYRVGCRAGYTSLFWSGDLYNTFEDVDRLENFISKHGVTHVLINKELIIPSDSPMINGEAVGFPQDWVNEIDNIGLKVDETEHYVLYEV